MCSSTRIAGWKQDEDEDASSSHGRIGNEASYKDRHVRMPYAINARPRQIVFKDTMAVIVDTVIFFKFFLFYFKN